jgi:hypothetical protein
VGNRGSALHAVRFFVVMVLVALGACQSLIDLGEEPELGCGIARAPGPACAECLESNCCESSFACSRDSTCKEAAETCLINCFEPACITECLQMYPGNKPLQEYFRCASGCPEECTPDEDCWDLAMCCPSVAGTTLHDGCILNARSEDQELCRQSLTVLGCDGQGGAPGE